MNTADKVRENRLRRMAERQGLRLEKNRRRDPRALDYGTYTLWNETSGKPESIYLHVADMSLDDVERYLTR